MTDLPTLVILTAGVIIGAVGAFFSWLHLNRAPPVPAGVSQTAVAGRDVYQTIVTRPLGAAPHEPPRPGGAFPSSSGNETGSRTSDLLVTTINLPPGGEMAHQFEFLGGTNIWGSYVELSKKSISMELLTEAERARQERRLAYASVYHYDGASNGSLWMPISVPGVYYLVFQPSGPRSKREIDVKLFKEQPPENG